MRERALICHPSAVAPAIRVEAGAWRGRGPTLHLRYRLAGQVDSLLLPPPASPRRAHELWKRSCFEAFVAAAGTRAYHEFNVSPSREWAIYRLDGYREGFAPVEHAQAPEIAVSRGHGQLQLDMAVDLSPLPELAAAGELRLGLSAVLEDAQRRLSYWALAHPSATPDFHHAGSFLLQLPADQR
jgi:hypothetical protein